MVTSAAVGMNQADRAPDSTRLADDRLDDVLREPNCRSNIHYQIR